MTETYLDRIGGLIRDARKHRGLTQTQLADVLGTSQSAVHRIEAGNQNLLIDGDVAFTGGVGVADHWLGNAQDADHWRDTQVKIEGPIVRLLEAVFYEDLVESASDEAVTPELTTTRACSTSPEHRCSFAAHQLAAPAISSVSTC